MIKYKVKVCETDFSRSYRVIMIEYEVSVLSHSFFCASVPGDEIKRVGVFNGSLSDCYAYIKLKEGDYM